MDCTSITSTAPKTTCKILDSSGRNADQVRLAANHQELRLYIDTNFQPADAIKPSTIFTPDFYIRDLSKNLDERIKQLGVLIGSIQKSHAASYALYEKCRTGALDSINDLDLMYFGGADPIKAVRAVLDIKRNHIAHEKAALMQLPAILDGHIRERAAAGHQLMMF